MYPREQQNKKVA